METALRRRALQLAARLLEQRFNRDHSDYQGSSLPCACGRRARYVERRWKGFHSVVGELKLERAYYYCWECERGFCPRDRTLGMDATSFSPAVVRMIGTVGAMVSFQEGSDLLTELAGVAVDAKQVERTAEGLGKEIAENERVHTEPLDAFPLPQTLHLGMDGTGRPRAGASAERHARVVLGDGAVWIWNIADDPFVGCHADRRPLSRQATLERSRKSSLRSHQPTNCSVGRTPERRTR